MVVAAADYTEIVLQLPYIIFRVVGATHTSYRATSLGILLIGTWYLGCSVCVECLSADELWNVVMCVRDARWRRACRVL